MAWARRALRDIKDLRDNSFVVLNEDMTEWTDNVKTFLVRLTGPKDTPYENARYHVRFTLSENFPFTSPSVGMVESVYHPNIDLASGSICLDSLNSKWSPVFTLRHVVEVLLPYLLTYPNPEDPLNREAAALMKQHPVSYAAKVKDLVAKYSFKDA